MQTSHTCQSCKPAILILLFYSPTALKPTASHFFYFSFFAVMQFGDIHYIEPKLCFKYFFVHDLLAGMYARQQNLCRPQQQLPAHNSSLRSKSLFCIAMRLLLMNFFFFFLLMMIIQHFSPHAGSQLLVNYHLPL